MFFDINTVLQLTPMGLVLLKVIMSLSVLGGIITSYYMYLEVIKNTKSTFTAVCLSFFTGLSTVLITPVVLILFLSVILTAGSILFFS